MDDELLNKISAEIGELKGIMVGVRDDLDSGKDKFNAIDQTCKEVDDRIRTLEQQQQWMDGKLAAFIMVIGAGVTLLIHFAIWIFDKVRFNH